MTATVLPFEPLRALLSDGGKARILRRRDNFKFCIDKPKIDHADDLMMDHADPCNRPSDSPYCAPDRDSA
jgi:hypothetical protein